MQVTTIFRTGLTKIIGSPYDLNMAARGTFRHSRVDSSKRQTTRSTSSWGRGMKHQTKRYTRYTFLSAEVLLLSKVIA